MPKENLSARITEQKVDIPCANFNYPQVSGLPDEEVEKRINQLIESQARSLVGEVNCADTTVTGNYTIGVNENGILSVKFEVYTYTQGYAHGMTYAKSLTFDLNTGRVYQLGDLFRLNSHYILRISDIIKEQIKERDLPLIYEFKRIKDDDPFYLTENALVVYFPIYEYTPYYVGIPEFTIPYSRIANLVREGGPIERLMENES